jgi:16S rRNA (guanine527-N7)-methyltransferase
MFHVKHAQLERFVTLLLRWNRTVNLIARRDEAAVWQRHVEDSLQLLPYLDPPPERAIDIGSGGGFPGLVLAIASGIPFDLIEADQRKAAFLREAARETGAAVRVHAVRIEAAAVPPAAVVTARALAPLPRLLGWAAPLLAPGGALLALKGAQADTELTEAAREWHMRVDKRPSRTHPDGCILRISEIARAQPERP